MKMAVPFIPDVVFIYNPSDSWLYLNTSNYNIPTLTQYDMSIPPNTYLIFVPYTPNTEYGALLRHPALDPIEWDCWIEFRRGEKELDWNVTPGFPVLQPLNPLPTPYVLAEDFAFTMEPIYEWAEYIDFTDTDGGFVQRQATMTHVPGTGWVNTAAACGGGNFQTIGSIINPFPSPWTAEIFYASVNYFNPNTSPQTLLSIATATGNVNNNPANNEIFSNSPTGVPNPFVAEFNGDTVARITIAFGGLCASGVTDPAIEDLLIAGTGVPPGIGELVAPPGAIVQFFGIASGTIEFWSWDFGDGTPIIFGSGSSFQDPLHVYEESGVYSVTMCVFGVFGNSSCFTADLYVDALAPEITEGI